MSNIDIIVNYFLQVSYYITGFFFIAAVILFLSVSLIRSRVWKNFKRSQYAK